MHGIALVQCTPVIGLDMWEHAYLSDYQGDKSAYFEKWWQHLNWPRVSQYFETHNLAGKVAPLLEK